jgi:hypothetical protein
MAIDLKMIIDELTLVRRLRILASRLGYELVMPRHAAQRYLAGTGPYLLVKHGTGQSLIEIAV